MVHELVRYMKFRRKSNIVEMASNISMVLWW